MKIISFIRKCFLFISQFYLNVFVRLSLHLWFFFQKIFNFIYYPVFLNFITLMYHFICENYHKNLKFYHFHMHFYNFIRNVIQKSSILSSNACTCFATYIPIVCVCHYLYMRFYLKKSSILTIFLLSSILSHINKM